MERRSHSTAGSALVLALIFLVAQSSPSEAWDPGGSRVTTQAGAQYAPLTLPSGSIVYSDSESLRVWVSRARIEASPFFGMYTWSQPVYQGSASAGLPRAADYLENSVLVTWSDARRGNPDIYVQRVGWDGVWPSFLWGGVPVCIADSAQTDPALVDDGAGGFYVAWTDARNAGADTDVYLQRFHEYGQVWEGWPDGGLRVSNAPGNQSEPVLFADGTGGVVVVWRDERSGDSDLYAEGFQPDGQRSPAWSADGSAVCVQPGEQGKHLLVPDGAGGAYLAWVDERSGTPLPYLTHLRADGQPTAGWWTAQGTCLSTDLFQSVRSMALSTDESTAVFVAWNWTYGDAGGVRVQRVRRDGLNTFLDPGVAVGEDPTRGTAPALLPDGTGGAFVAWSAGDPLSADLRANRVDSTGAFARYWTYDGVVVSDAAGAQTLPDRWIGGVPYGPILQDGRGGFIVVWTDTRRPDDADLYAQRVTRNGTVAPVPLTTCWEYCGPPDYIRRVFPNPTRGDLTVRAWVPDDRAVFVDLYDVRGVLRSTWRTPRLRGGGDMDIPVPMGALPSGVYFLRYRVDGSTPGVNQGSRRIVYVR